ncbi:MAG: META domain-containing protein [Mesonia hippocampi]|uniref:META domain-containing protein n=1 Tax=Mesonia hippocampi TaxID=1628250 RepID=UPI003F9A4A52
MKKIILFLAVTFSLMACQSTSPSKDLVEGTYNVTNVEAQDVTTFNVSIVIDETKTKLSGKSGCNSYAGALALGENNTFDADKLGLTRMYCKDRMEVERSFIEAMTATSHYMFDGEVLLLNNTEGKTLIKAQLQKK